MDTHFLNFFIRLVYQIVGVLFILSTAKAKLGFGTGTIRNLYELRQPENTNTSDTR